MSALIKTAVKTILWGAGGLAATCLALLIVFQEKLVYVPELPGVGKAYPYTPARLRMLYEDVWLKAKDGTKLHCWLIKNSPDASDIAHRLDSIAILMRRLHCNVFMLSYRGYGASDGSPTQKGIALDAQASLEYLLARPDIESERVVVFGRSLGGAVGANLVHANPGKVAGLIVENTFTSILDMAGVMLPFLKYFLGSDRFRPLNLVVRSPWRTIDVIGKVHAPTLFLSGSMDEMVPPRHMRQLYAAALTNQKCRFVEFPDGAHMDTWIRGGERYWAALAEFMAAHAGIRQQDGVVG